MDDALVGNKYSYLRPHKEFFEIGIKCDKVFAELNDHRRKPRIRNIVGGQFLVHAQLPQYGPFATEMGHVDARHGKEGVQKLYGIDCRSWLNKYPGISY